MTQTRSKGPNGLPEVALARVVDNQYNPRDFDSQAERRALDQLIASIRSVGLLNPPVLYQIKDSRYLAPISGHRRIHAMRQLGFEATRYIPTSWLGLPAAMTDKEALRYILADQDVTKPYRPLAKMRVAWEADALDLELEAFDTPFWRQRRYVVEHAPGWLKDAILQKQIGIADSFEILRFALEHMRDETWIALIAKARMERRIADRDELRRVMKQAKADPVFAAALRDRLALREAAG